MPRYLSVEALNALAVKAMDAGVYPKVHRDRGLIGRSLEWDVSGRCRAPVVVELHARYGVDPRKRVKPWWIFMTVPCRKCEHCLRTRAQCWRQRALQEYSACSAAGGRTWLVTLTYSPDYWVQLLALARSYCSMQGVNFDELPDMEKFRACVAETGGEFDRFGKRIRGTRPPRPFRYLWVSERHKSGVLHWHGLVHECDPELPLRKAHIQRAWYCGFSNVKLVKTQGAALYVTKYISKEVHMRVRASQMYGDFAYGKIFNDLDRRSALLAGRGVPDPSKGLIPYGVD